MKKIKKIVTGVLVGGACLSVLASCKDDEKTTSQTSVTYVSGTTVPDDQKGDAVVGISSSTINDKGELIITYTDGNVVNLGVVKGQDAPLESKAFTIAKSFGYKGDYGKWVDQIVSGELSVQYAVDVASDYASFTYGWDQKRVELGENAILLDNRFTDEEVNSHRYIFNDIKKAIEAAKDGTEEKPMVIYIAPGVYWTHDPNSELTTDAFQITKTCENMQWVGLTDDNRNVVLAFDYGHDVGYNGSNPTCFNIGGDSFTIKNLTVGGYCNVDLQFNLNTSYNHEKRSTNVTQCQLGTYSGDKLYCENVSFVSRLNMMPFVSSKRALYVDCHLESTDDSLNGSSKAVYLNCDFDFYASKPWAGSSGATLLNCDLNITHINIGLNPVQYLTKGAGRVNVIDCRFKDDTNAQTYNIGWSDVLASTFRSYYSNVTYNGVKTDFSDGGKNADKGVDLTGTDALQAYKITTSKGKTIYNIYNLLKGNDSWDPLGQKEIIESYNAQDIPTTLTASLSKNSIECAKEGEDEAVITCNILGDSQSYTDNLTYTVKEADAAYVRLTKNEDGTCTVKSINDSEQTVKVVVEAKTDAGLCAAVELTVAPSKLPIAKASNTSIAQDGAKAYLSYTIEDLGLRADNSRIKWYVADDTNLTNLRLIAEGRGDSPLKELDLYEAYIGKYLVAKIETKHVRSDYQEAVTCISDSPVSATGIDKMSTYNVDLATFATVNNNSVVKGYWNANNVAYGVGGKNGFAGYTGLYFTGSKSTAKPYSEIDYTPVEGTYGDMDVTLKVAPGKTAAQGFGSKNNFIEIRVKYDVATDTGYAVRVVRNSGDSTIVQLVKLNGLTEAGARNVEVLATSVDTSVYLTECSIHVWTENGKLKTHIETSQAQPDTAKEKSYLHEVDLSCDISENAFGGFGAYYESSTGDNTTYIGELVITYAM